MTAGSYQRHTWLGPGSVVSTACQKSTGLVTKFPVIFMLKVVAWKSFSVFSLILFYLLNWASFQRIAAAWGKRFCCPTIPDLTINFHFSFGLLPSKKAHGAGGIQHGIWNSAPVTEFGAQHYLPDLVLQDTSGLMSWWDLIEADKISADCCWEMINSTAAKHSHCWVSIWDNTLYVSLWQNLSQGA